MMGTMAMEIEDIQAGLLSAQVHPPLLVLVAVM